MSNDFAQDDSMSAIVNSVYDMRTKNADVQTSQKSDGI